MASNLPQSDAGVPVAGIDPTMDEMGSLNSVQDIAKWLGAQHPLLQALADGLGTPTPKLRDLVYIKQTDWDAMVTGMVLPNGSDGTRPLKPLERGHLDVFRRIARLRLGLSPLEESTAHTTTQ